MSVSSLGLVLVWPVAQGLAKSNQSRPVVSPPMHIHILGICGTFMGGVAALAREAGHKVTGCDAGVYPPMSDQLRALGIELIEGYGADQVQLQPDMFVVGTSSQPGSLGRWLAQNFR